MAFYLKINKKILSFLGLFILSIQFVAQESSSYWQVDYGIGSIIKHKAIMGHLVTAHPEFVSVTWQKNASLDETWKQNFNYPDWGITLIHQEFKNPSLGTITALNYTTTYYLRNRNKKRHINLQMGIGAGYNSTPLDLEENNQNVAISTPILFSQHLKINYLYPNIIDKFGLHLGLNFTHFSNATYKSPNFGINTLFLNAGVNYVLNDSKTIYPERPLKKTFEREAYKFSLGFQAGLHEAKAGLGTKPTFSLKIQAEKRIGQKSGLLGGFDFFNSLAAKEYAIFRFHTRIEEENRVLLDHKQVGVYFGHDLYFDKIILETSLGYYIYNPLQVTPSIYEKIAVKHKFDNLKLNISLNLKVHYFKAESASIGIAYQFL